MKRGVTLYLDRDKATGIAAALLLHAVLLYGLGSYRHSPPQSEALTVFVSLVSPAVPASSAPPRPVTPKAVAAKPATKQETRRAVTPAAPQVSTSPAPIAVPAEPAELPLPVAKLQPGPSPVNLPAAGSPVSMSAGPAGAQPVLLNNELSVSCSERTPPAYPKQSLRLGEYGKTILLVELDELGRVAHVDIKTKSGFPRLDEAAINAIKTWRCAPAKRNGVAVRSVAVQPFNFTIKGR